MSFCSSNTEENQTESFVRARLSPREEVFRRRRQPSYCFLPLSAEGVIAGDFAGPCMREVFWGSSEEDESLPWRRRPNLLVEFERFCRGVSAKV